MNLYKSTHLLTTLLPILLFFLPCRATQGYECKTDSPDNFFENEKLFEQHNEGEIEKPFLVAAKEGNLKTLEKLEKIGADINTTDPDGNTALHLAITNGASFELLFWLVHIAKVNMSRQNKPKQTSYFLLAAKKGNSAALCILYAKNPDVINTTDQNGNNALHLAAGYTLEGTEVEWLLDTTKLRIESKNKSGLTPFLCAAEKGNLPALKLLKEKGANVNKKDKSGSNALHSAAAYAPEGKGIVWLIDTVDLSIESQGNREATPFLFAAEAGNLDALTILHAKGANVNATCQYGNNALHYAARYAPEGKGIGWLVDTAEINIESKGYHQRTAFLCAAEKGNLSALKILQKKGANLNATDQDGDNALHYAALAPEGKGIPWLIDIAKIAIESKGNDQKTAFLFAAEKGKLEALKILKAKGASLYATDQYGNNALHLAALYAPKEKGIAWLIDTAKIAIESKGNDQKTAFLFAVEKGNLSALKILQRKGANLNATDQYGYNALHVAIGSYSFTKVIEWLIHTAKINIEFKGNDQKTPFLYAAEKGNLTALKILKEEGANINAKDQNDDNALALAKKNSADQATIDWLEKQFNVKKKQNILSFFRK